MTDEARKYPIKTVAALVAILVVALIIVTRQQNANSHEFDRCLDRVTASGSTAYDTCTD